MKLTYVEGLLQEECKEVEQFCQLRGLVQYTTYWQGSPPNSNPRRHNRVLVPDDVANGIRVYLGNSGYGSMSLGQFLEKLLPKT